MHSQNPLLPLEQTLKDASDAFAAAQVRYASPVIRLLTNNGAGYEISVESQPPDESAVLVVWHSEQLIALTGSEQLAVGELTAWWAYPDETTSQPCTVPVY